MVRELAGDCESITEADVDELRSRIAEAAFYKAERRGFAPGHEVSDWVEAEREIRQQINRHLTTPP